MELSLFLESAVKYVAGTITVELLNRDAEGCVVGRAEVPVRLVKPDYDGNGVVVRLEWADVLTAEWVGECPSLQRAIEPSTGADYD